MTTLIYLCVILTNGFVGCQEYDNMARCEQVEAGLDHSVLEKSDCTIIEMRKGTEYAPDKSPIPTPRPSSI